MGENLILHPNEHWLELTLELASRGDVPYQGPPSIPLNRIHEAARKAQETPGKMFTARPPWTSLYRWGFSDCVSFTVFDVPGLAQSRVRQVVVTSHSRYKIHAFVNLIAGLRGAGSSLDETLRTSQEYGLVGDRGYWVGIAAIPGSRLGR